MTKDPNDRYYRIQVAFHPDDAVRLMEQAWASGKSVSGFIRDIVKKELDLETRPEDTTPYVLPKRNRFSTFLKGSLLKLSQKF